MPFDKRNAGMLKAVGFSITDEPGDEPGVHGEVASVKGEMRASVVRGGGARPPAIAYSRVGRGRIPSAAPSNSNFPASHSGLEHGLIAQSC